MDLQHQAPPPLVVLEAREFAMSYQLVGMCCFVNLMSMENWILGSTVNEGLVFFVLLACFMPIKLIKKLLFDLFKIRYAGWMDWLGRKCRKFLKHLCLNLYIIMPVIWLNIAALDFWQGMVLIFILPSRYWRTVLWMIC